MSGQSDALAEAEWFDPGRILSVLPGRGCSYDELAPRHVVAEIGGVAVHIAALDDIVASKEHADREKDREALPELRELQRRYRG